jgi:1,4-alpha-glucan branching enzyme
LIIYELHIGDFLGKFADITAKMDYFIELGVTAGK